MSRDNGSHCEVHSPSRTPATSRNLTSVGRCSRVGEAGLPPLRGKQHVNGRLSPQQQRDVLSVNVSIKPQEDLLHTRHTDPLGPLSPSHHITGWMKRSYLSSLPPSFNSPPRPSPQQQSEFNCHLHRERHDGHHLNQNTVLLEDDPSRSTQLLFRVGSPPCSVAHRQ